MWKFGALPYINLTKSGCRYINLNGGQAKCKPENDFEINENDTLEGLRLCPCMGGM